MKITEQLHIFTHIVRISNTRNSYDIRDRLNELPQLKFLYWNTPLCNEVACEL